MPSKRLPFRLQIASLCTVLCTFSALSYANGIKKGDPNPGSIPNTILEEPTSLELTNLGGHKVYAGQDKLRNVQLAYLNVDFDCNGKAQVEGFKKTYKGNLDEVTKGTYDWSLRDDHARLKTELVAWSEEKNQEYWLPIAVIWKTALFHVLCNTQTVAANEYHSAVL